MDKAGKWIVYALFLIFILYYLGILDKIPVVKNLPFFDNIEFSDNCIRKKISGIYDMSIKFEKSDVEDFVVQQLEIYYQLKIDQDRCELYGEGFKVGDRSKDFASGKMNENQFKNGEFPIVMNGRIEGDTILLDLSFKTNSTEDYTVNAIFVSVNSKINSLKGTFKESKNNSSGKSKLARVD